MGNLISLDTENESSFEKGLIAPITDMIKLNKMAQLLRDDKQGERNYLLFIIGLNTGLKVSEYTEMTVGQFREICNQGYIEINSTVVNISDSLNKCITEYIKDKQDTDYMFPSKKGGTPIKRQTVWLILNDAAKEAGINETLGNHTIRKTFGYWHYKQNNDIKTLMKIFKQSSPEVTLRYIGINTDDNKNMSLGIN